MEPLKPGQNPRDVMPSHRERGPVRYQFTIETFASAAGLSISTVRGRKFERSMDLITPAALRDIAENVQRYAARASVPLSDADGLALLDAYYPVDDDKRLAQWAARWPRFDVFRCASLDCRNGLLQGGFCASHGGPESPAIAFKGSYFVLRVGGVYLPYHRVVTGCPRGRDVHHVDENKWNNRPENLLILTHDEHWALHHDGLKRKASAPVD